MTSEHDRLLAEGPRTAPEPPTAPDLDGRPAPAAPAAPFFDDTAAGQSASGTFEPVGQEPTTRSPVTPSGSRPRAGSRRSLARLLVPAAVATVVVARAAFDGHGGGSAAFLVVWLAVLALGIGLRRRRW
jgi:hypothetical protein